MLIAAANTGGYMQYRIPGLVVTQGGVLLACFECRKSSSDWADMDIRILRSTDDGETWETRFVDTPAGYADIAVRNGCVYVFYERDCVRGGLYFQKIRI